MTATAESTAPPPLLATLGLVSIGLGALMLIFNIVAPLSASASIPPGEAAGIAQTLLAIIAGLMVLESLLLMIGGIGMQRGRPWGRSVALVFAWSILPCVLLTGGLVGGLKAALEQQGGGSFSLLLGGALLSPLFAIVLLITLLRGDIARWAERAQWGDQPIPPRNQLAILSLVLAFVPMMLLTQLASLILGIVAAVRISRSKGRERGLGMAIAGAVISFIILAGIGALIVAMLADEKSR